MVSSGTVDETKETSYELAVAVESAAVVEEDSTSDELAAVDVDSSSCSVTVEDCVAVVLRVEVGLDSSPSSVDPELEIADQLAVVVAEDDDVMSVVAADEVVSVVADAAVLLLDVAAAVVATRLAEVELLVVDAEVSIEELADLVVSPSSFVAEVD